MGKVVSEPQTEPGDPADQGKYLAEFPEEFPMRLIRMFSVAGETVLDPFMRSGRLPMHPAASEMADLIETILAAVIKNDGFDGDLW